MKPDDINKHAPSIGIIRTGTKGLSQPAENSEYPCVRTSIGHKSVEWVCALVLPFFAFRPESEKPLRLGREGGYKSWVRYQSVFLPYNAFMFALQKPIRRKGTAVWQILFCLTVISFLCRSVIPMGYMPDLSGGRDGKLAITFCTAGGGTSTLQLDLTGQPEQPSSDEHAGSQECPFGLVVSQAVMPSQDATVLVGMISDRPAVLLHRNHTLPPLPALGPPLGSRAPPSNLG